MLSCAQNWWRALACVPHARFYIDAYLNKQIFKNESEMFEPAAVKTGSWIDQLIISLI